MRPPQMLRMCREERLGQLPDASASHSGYQDAQEILRVVDVDPEVLVGMADVLLDSDFPGPSTEFKES